RLDVEFESRPQTPASAGSHLDRLAVAAAEATASLGGEDEPVWWGTALRSSLDDHRDDLRLFAPWAPRLSRSLDSWRRIKPELFARLEAIQARLATIATLRNVAESPE